MRTLYLDCFAGISGNMLLGALLDVGMPEKILREELAKLPITEYQLTVEKVSKCGIRATYVNVTLSEHQHHRHLSDIIDIIDHSALDASVKDKSKKVFMRLAQAEAKVHDTTVDDIHFHEVGAVDAIIDIVGVVFGLHYLDIKEIYASKLHVGNGFVKCSHGLMPVPAPATAELLKGIPYYNGEIARELVTPTGAALLSTLAKDYGMMPKDFISQSIGYGAGTWDLDIPNVLRLYVGDTDVQPASDDIVVVETNIDDLNPQVYAYVMDKLFTLGALDVWLTPIIMKKGRPATTLSVLINRRVFDATIDVLFTETSTIGMRYYAVDRAVAEREIFPVSIYCGQARVKISTYRGKLCSITPEYEDCKQLAEQNGVPLKLIQQAVLEAGSKVYQKKK